MDAVARRIEVSWDDPSSSAEAVQISSGLAFLEAIRDGRLPAPPVARLLGLDLIRVDTEAASFAITCGEQHYNLTGSVHGGVLSTLADSAMACAVHARLPAGTAYTTLDLTVNFVRAVTVRTGRVIATGRVIHLGQRTATAECRVEDEAGKLYAHGSTTCMIFPTR